MDTKQGVVVSSGKSSPRAFREHVACSFAYKIVSSVDPDFSKPLVSYRGEDAVEMFVRKLQEEAEQLFDEYNATPKPLLPLTVPELRSFGSGSFKQSTNSIRASFDSVKFIATISSS